MDENALREALDAGEEFRGRGDARFLGGLEGPRDGALEGLRPQSGLEHGVLCGSEVKLFGKCPSAHCSR